MIPSARAARSLAPTALGAALLLAALCAMLPRLVAAQSEPTDSTTAVFDDPRVVGQRAQARFESFRRANLPAHRGRMARECQERVGRFCYWYDEESPPPAPELPAVTRMRTELIRQLDSLARSLPSDEWLVGQRIRYLDEAGRNEEALTAARECRSYGWWCHALEGFALHQLGRYAKAEVAWDSTLAQMSAPMRCLWTDIALYLDDDTRRQYSRNACGSPQREAFERRTWWLSRARYGLDGNDSRSEHFARTTYGEFLRAAPSAYMFGFDEDERELLLRFGWSRHWSRGPDVPMGAGGPRQVNIIGHDPSPAYRYIPPYYVLTSPVTSDSTDWAVQLPPVVARYQPPYAKHLYMLEHQKGLFRRGDTALVVLAYDVTKVERLRGTTLEAALIATPTGDPQQNQTIRRAAPARGTLIVRAPWGPLLMSAEIAAPDSSTLVRARYGIRPPLATGTRVSLSDLLFYEPYGDFPTSIEEALPHALPTQVVRSSQKLGVFWEAYGTNPDGEQMTISLTVVTDSEEAGAVRRAARALRLARESAPVSITVTDVSARGSSRSARALELDISTLRRGEYLVQLEVTVAGQYSIRADRRMVVIP
ncbi:MAG: hypothetical protein KF689_04485 [Gemmatimonadaceae bacterium]|nr:hypothetical protein [Gemmatimonadaceae bacterium]MCW5825571.1 hypothetical protein [Gemmatimonadaceae bacterium]